mmetsp:Transcript_8147/g.20218  ORF Transcript_8147/g.20218 Transcript_8147/m.20218 type:complete len:241 (+) Transcript_8147:1344-2066(+)
MSCKAPVRTRFWMDWKKSFPEKNVMSGSKSQKCFSEKNSSSSSGVRLAIMAATTEPTLLPATTLGKHPRALRARATPTWNVPSVPPPLSISAVRPKQCRVSCRKASFSCNGMSCSCAIIRSCARVSSMYSRTARGTPHRGSCSLRPMLVMLPRLRRISARRLNIISSTLPDARCARSSRSCSSMSSLSYVRDPSPQNDDVADTAAFFPPPFAVVLSGATAAALAVSSRASMRCATRLKSS